MFVLFHAFPFFAKVIADGSHGVFGGVSDSFPLSSFDGPHVVFNVGSFYSVFFRCTLDVLCWLFFSSSFSVFRFLSLYFRHYGCWVHFGSFPLFRGGFCRKNRLCFILVASVCVFLSKVFL